MRTTVIKSIARISRLRAQGGPGQGVDVLEDLLDEGDDARERAAQALAAALHALQRVAAHLHRTRAPALVGATCEQDRAGGVIRRRARLQLLGTAWRDGEPEARRLRAKPRRRGMPASAGKLCVVGTSPTPYNNIARELEIPACGVENGHEATLLHRCARQQRGYGDAHAARASSICPLLRSRFRPVGRPGTCAAQY